MVETYRPRQDVVVTHEGSLDYGRPMEAAPAPAWEKEHVVFEQQHLGRGRQSELADRFDALSEPVKTYLTVGRSLQNPELSPEARVRLNNDQTELLQHILEVDRGTELVNFINFRDRNTYRNGVNGHDNRK